MITEVMMNRTINSKIALMLKGLGSLYPIFGLAGALFLTTCTHSPTSTSRELMSSDHRLPAQERLTLPIEERRLSFEWPVEDARLTRGYLPKKRRPHLGIDLASHRGTSIYAAHGGQVLYAGRDFRGYGKMILIESGSGWATLYAHLDRILVDEGETVTPKDIIGLMGRTGRATGVHLHFEIRRNKEPVDPLGYLPGGARIAQISSPSSLTSSDYTY